MNVLCGARFGWLALALLVACGACQTAHRDAAPTPTASALRGGEAGAPRAASSFECRDAVCRQAHPRLPDTGEWRCAERDGVVWCAGGEAAAGVVKGVADARFRCGPRWGKNGSERVCIDQHPDYPDDAPERYRCRFDQEQSIARVCSAVAKASAAATTPPTAAAEVENTANRRGAPACWLDRDCASGKCALGVCACGAAQDCQLGSCERGYCVEAAR